MSLENTLNKLRTDGNMSQERFAEVLGVSRQSVQKWESGACVPELDKLIRIAKHFGISLDALILGRDERFADDINFGRKIRPKYEKMSKWEIYCADLPIEYEQCIDEGLDLKEYGELFRAVSLLPWNDAKARIADVIFDIVLNAKTAEGYPYTEPSDLDGIRRLRRSAPALSPPDKSALEGKILGAWTGRICGCLLGKPIEGVRTDELIPFLKDCGNYPMHRYIMKRDADAEIMKKYRFGIAEFCMADVIDGMPIDNDVNYTVLAQRIVDRHGRDFTSYDVSRDWMTLIGRYSCCTAERVAYRNFVNGYEPPESAVYKNPYREWIGAQIRGDYFGYINPGNPELAAEMAHRDACISHVKNGIYGEMFVAAMLAAAACTDDFEAVVSCGLAQIPYTSRLHQAVTDVLNGYRDGVPAAQCFADIHRRYDEHTEYGWCHTVPNAMIVAAAILYGGGDFSKSVCMAAETGFDTDCNGATVGSVVGMAKGIGCIDESWTKPINNTVRTSVFGVEEVSVSELAAQTLKHIG